MGKKKIRIVSICLSALLIIQSANVVWASSDWTEKDIQQTSVDTMDIGNPDYTEAEKLGDQEVVEEEYSDEDVVGEVFTENDIEEQVMVSEEGNPQNAVVLIGNNLYCNGNSIVIKKEEERVFVFDGTGEKKLLEGPITNPAALTVYGGMKDISCSSNVSIVVDGIQIKGIYGGGYSDSEDVLADLNGNVHIGMQNGAKASSLYGGGYNSRVQGNVDIVLDNATVSSEFYGGGYSDGGGVSDVTGDVGISVTGNVDVAGVHGGGKANAIKNDASACVRGDISIQITDTPKGNHGWLYGGGAAYTNAEFSAIADTGNISLSVGGRIYSVRGGGNAHAGKGASGYVSANTGDVQLNINKADIREVYGGGYAAVDSEAGSEAEACANTSSVSTSITECEIMILRGGGDASGNATANVENTTDILLDSCPNIYGYIMGGGSASAGGTVQSGDISLSVIKCVIPVDEQLGSLVAAAFYGGSEVGSGSSIVTGDIRMSFTENTGAGNIYGGSEVSGNGSAVMDDITVSLKDSEGYNYVDEDAEKSGVYYFSIFTAGELEKNEGSRAEMGECNVILDKSTVENVWGGYVDNNAPSSCDEKSTLSLTDSSVTDSVACFDNIMLDQTLSLKSFLFKSTPNQTSDYTTGTPTKLIPSGALKEGAVLVNCEDTDSEENWFILKDGELEYQQVNAENKSEWKIKDIYPPVRLSKTSTIMTVGESGILKVLLTEAYEGQTVSWSADSGVVSVENSGIIIAEQQGKSIVEAILPDGNSAQCEVTVVPKKEMTDNNLVIKEEGIEETIKTVKDVITSDSTCKNAFEGVSLDNIVIKEISAKIPDVNNITFLIPYQEIDDTGSITEKNYSEYYFSILHLKHQENGTTVPELPHYVATKEGLRVTVSSLSPFAFAYKKATSENKLMHTLNFQTDNGTTIAEQQVAENALASVVESPTRSGYSFSGWYRDSGHTQPWDFNKDAVLQDTTLYAKWERKASPAPVWRYLVTFDSQDGSQLKSVSAISGSRITEPDAPVRQGYTFLGWYKDCECTQIWDFSTDIVDGDITLYAGWQVVATPTPEPTPQPTLEPTPEPVKVIAPKLKVKSNTTKSITLTWSKVSGVSGYVVYGYKKGDMKNVIERKIIKPTQKSVSLKYSPGTARSYYIRAYKKVNGKNYYSKVSNKVTTATRPSTAAIKSVVVGKEGVNIRLKAKAKGARGYAYCVFANNKRYRVAERTSKTSCKINKLKKGERYIRVRSYTLDHKGKRIYGDWSKAAKIEK